MNKIIESLADLEGESDVRLRIEQAHAQGSAVLPLSSAQQGIWFAQQIDPSSPAYNIGEYIELNGRIDALLFERALRKVVVESEALRVQIIDLAGQAGQIVGPPPAWSMAVIDVSAETDPRAAAKSWSFQQHVVLGNRVADPPYRVDQRQQRAVPCYEVSERAAA